MWYEERIDKQRNTRNPKFGLCCLNGKVQLPLLKEAPNFLKNLLDHNGGQRSAKFKENIRAYNSMFAFTSIGGVIDNKINNGGGPYVFRISGQNHHKIGSLLPTNGARPKFAQLYIYDTENEVSNRLGVMNFDGSTRGLNTEIVTGLLIMLDENNQLARIFRMARDRFKESDYVLVSIKLIGTRKKDGRQYNLPTASEVAALIVGNGDESTSKRDVVVQEQSGGLRRISELHPSFMAMQYPLLFPYGEDGYHTDIMHREAETGNSKSNKLTQRQYHAFRLQFRHNEGHTLIGSGRLTQQYMVDCFTSMQAERFGWVMRNQPKLRCDVLQRLEDAVVRGDTRSSFAKKRIILPSSITGSPRYMVQNYQDSIAICRWAGPPDLFITFTCNPKWPEINEFLKLIPGQKPEDRPDVVTRVFKIKLDQLIKDLTKGQHFGRVRAVIYTIEFQKRGLPHAHIALFLIPDDKPIDASLVDRLISAELPDEQTDPVAYKAIVQFMMHGPCGNANTRSPCMENGTCSKHYPKQFQSQTSISEDGFPIYRRSDNKRTVIVNGIELDNTWVVPHNVYLVVKYDSHINVELCNQSRCIKYLFKYMCKGEDKATCLIQENVSVDKETGREIVTEVDEIKRYLNCRYVSASEACWRIFQFDIQHREPAVERLTFHLPHEQNVIFHDDEDLRDVLNRRNIDKTMFTEWMRTNVLHKMQGI